MKNKFSTLRLLFLLTVSVFSHADNKPLIVGSEQNYPPFALGLTDAEADGFTVELWRAVAAEAHLTSTIRVLPFHQILNQFKAGQIDVLINLAQSDERRQFVDFSLPHVVVHGAIFVRKGENSIHAEQDLNHKAIIVLNADLAHDYAIAKGWQKQLLLVDTAEAGFKLLASGKSDALLLSKLVGQQTLEKENLTNIKVLPIKVGFAQKFSFAVHKGQADLLAQLNEGLAITKANGTYDRLYEKWFGVYEEKSLWPLLLKYLAPTIIFFLSILVFDFYLHALERKKAIRKLQQSDLRLRKANADLTRLSEVSAHNLMEPTRRLTIYTQKLQKQISALALDPACAEQLKSDLDYLQADAARLQTLLQGIKLYLTASEPRGKMQLEDTNKVIAELQKQFSFKNRAVNVPLTWQNLPAAFLDYPRLLDLFGLIIDNALTHGPPPTTAHVKAHIQISGAHVGHHCRYQISDNGAGIPAEYHERVFGIFERLSHNNKTSSGIGLAIARKIVESCGGKIWIENTSHIGTTVIFELPDGGL